MVSIIRKILKIILELPGAFLVPPGLFMLTSPATLFLKG
jgi:hypothetical protein